jgi:ribosomal protein S18 acetylase RimI-like enzyme
MRTFTIRGGRPEDAEVIAGFNRAMAEETEAKKLDHGISVAGVRALLERPQHGTYTVAESGGEVVGSLMITTEWSDWRNGFFWWVQSVYVIPSFRRQGVYRALYGHVRMSARCQTDVCGIRLYVENENTGAQKTYESLGMQKTGYRLYEELL